MADMEKNKIKSAVDRSIMRSRLKALKEKKGDLTEDEKRLMAKLKSAIESSISKETKEAGKITPEKRASLIERAKENEELEKEVKPTIMESIKMGVENIMDEGTNLDEPDLVEKRRKRLELLKKKRKKNR
jgi:hypothetical protein